MGHVPVVIVWILPKRFPAESDSFRFQTNMFTNTKTPLAERSKFIPGERRQAMTTKASDAAFSASFRRPSPGWNSTKQIKFGSLQTVRQMYCNAIRTSGLRSGRYCTTQNRRPSRYNSITESSYTTGVEVPLTVPCGTHERIPKKRHKKTQG